MTHEYVIALHGRVGGLGPGPRDDVPTAVAWAANRVLAVGPDDVVRSISRGDSTFLDLCGCVITALPADPTRADALMRDASARSGPDLDVTALLTDAGLLEPGSELEAGSPADLAFWGTSTEPGAGRGAAHAQRDLRLVAVVRGGAFTEGDEHRGPFPTATAIAP